jgi:S-DNA-T family DNA segregation ATPase FtsK/SpoIIIE
MIDASETIRDTKTFNNYYSVNSKDIIEQIDKMKEDTSKTHVILILSIESFMNALSKEEQKSIKDKFAMLKSTPNIRVIISDAVNKIKPLEYDEFYRSCVQPINAVWVGSGITDQFTIKSSTYNKQTRSQIPADFGYNVDRGNAKFIKVLDFYTRD